MIFSYGLAYTEISFMMAECKLMCEPASKNSTVLCSVQVNNKSIEVGHQIFRKRHLQFQKPYQIVKSECYETF